MGKTKVKLSPREERLFQALSPNWKDTHDLCVAEFGGHEKSWPLHARQLVTGALRGINKKLRHFRSTSRLEQKGGGRGGNKYRLVS